MFSKKNLYLNKMFPNNFFSFLRIGKNKNFENLKKKAKLKIFKILIFIPSLFLILFLLIILKVFLKKYKRIISLRISPRYFGHLAIEPAILSALTSGQSEIYPLVSIKKIKGPKNKTLLNIAKSSFNIKNDFLNLLIENIYNYSFKNLREKINPFYSPLLHPKLNTREITYIDFMDTEKSFKWRKNARNLIYSNNQENDFKLIIALRTEHFNKKIMNPQPWRDSSNEDILYLCKVFSKTFDPKKIYLYYNPENNELIEDKELKKSGINYVDETKVDILSFFSPNTILINNGNGIGSAALAIGIKTLYIHHTAWQFWHTSHANSFCIPNIFSNVNSNNISNIEEIISFVFSTKNILPLDFPRDYYQRGIKINRIKDIKESILINTLNQMINTKEKSIRAQEDFMGCKFDYSNAKERFFWENYISKMPEELRFCHKKIKLNISDSFLNNF